MPIFNFHHTYVSRYYNYPYLIDEETETQRFSNHTLFKGQSQDPNTSLSNSDTYIFDVCSIIADSP